MRFDEADHQQVRLVGGPALERLDRTLRRPGRAVMLLGQVGDQRAARVPVFLRGAGPIVAHELILQIVAIDQSMLPEVAMIVVVPPPRTVLLGQDHLAVTDVEIGRGVVHLANRFGAVAGRSQDFREGGDLGRQGAVIAPTSMLVDVAPAHQRVARGRADWEGTEAVVVAYAVMGQPVDMRRLDVRVTIGPETFDAMLVRVDDQNVRTSGVSRFGTRPLRSQLCRGDSAGGFQEVASIQILLHSNDLSHPASVSHVI